MFTTFRAVKWGVAATAVLVTSLACAHPKLLASSPADKAEGPAPAQIALHFSEKLVPRFTGATLVMTGVPGATSGGATSIPARVSQGGDGKTLTLVPAQPLAPGAYRVDWHAVAADTHRVSGNLTFQVK